MLSTNWLKAMEAAKEQACKDAEKEHTLTGRISFIKGIDAYAQGWNKYMQETKDAQDICME